MKVKLMTAVALSVFIIAPLTVALPSIEDGSNNSNVWVGSNNGYDTTGETIAVTQDQSLNLAQRVAMVQQSLNNINQMDFPSQIQSLEQELQSMQGSIEELNHKLEVLKRAQEKQADLLSGELTTSAPVDLADQALQAQPALQADLAAETSAVALSAASALNTVLPPGQQEQKTYEAAFSLITSHAYDDAIQAMQSYIRIYSDDGKYAANGYYWLGELYAQQKNYANALSHLETVVEQYPDSNKAPDAMLKLGIINQQQGDNVQAKKWFDTVTGQYPNSSSARLAKSYL